MLLSLSSPPKKHQKAMTALRLGLLSATLLSVTLAPRPALSRALSSSGHGLRVTFRAIQRQPGDPESSSMGGRRAEMVQKRRRFQGELPKYVEISQEALLAAAVVQGKSLCRVCESLYDICTNMSYNIKTYNYNNIYINITNYYIMYIYIQFTHDIMRTEDVKKLLKMGASDGRCRKSID